MSEKSVKTGEKLKKDTKFKSGAEWTGNRKGRPKGSVSIVGAAKEILRKDPTRLQELAQDLLKNKKLRVELIRQIDGMPKMKHEVGGKDGGPITLNIVKYAEPGSFKKKPVKVATTPPEVK